MIFKILGILDIASACVITLHSITPVSIMRMLAGYLFVKGIIFSTIGDIASILDVLCSFYMIALSFSMDFWIITIITVVFLAQKGLMTILG